MKKVLVLILLLVFITPVYARENRLYFTESDERIYYESKLIDEDYFLKHTDMVPGESFRDELVIENGTKTKYTLYFKVVPREQSKESNELLENILMKISIDGEVIYEGNALGVDYTEDGINLQEAVLLGDFQADKESKMIVETTLSKEYSNTEYRELSYIDWAFYAQYEDSDPEEIVKIPDTGIGGSSTTSIFPIIIILIGLGIMFYMYKKEVK